MAGTYKTFSEYTEAIPWTVRVVREGDSYGLNMMLVHDGKPMVEFYDGRYPHSKDSDGNMLGQFVSRYYIDTLTKPRWHAPAYGLNLEGNVPEWSISAALMRDIVDWLDRNASILELIEGE